MLNTLIDNTSVPNFARLEVQNGYPGLVTLHNIYSGFIALNTRKGRYTGPPKVPILKSMLEEYLAETTRRAA